MSKIIRLPGAIDIHVHLRDPGQTHKEDFYSGTASALAGGITTIFDMPNNLQPILTSQMLLEKINIVRQKAVCDWGLYFGTNGKNNDEFVKVADKVVGLKIYLNMTTGKLLIEDEELVERVFKLWPQNKIIVVHAEGEKVDLAIRLAGKYGNKLHITHVNKKEMLEKIMEAKKSGLTVTCDVTPHHLFLSNGDLKQLGGFGVVKPPLASKKDTEFLWENLTSIDCIASDHASHTTGEKQANNPPSGFPGLETLLPLLFTAIKQGRLRIEDVIRLTNANPQKIFDIKIDKQTFVEVDTEERYMIENKKLLTKCGWSPFAGWEVFGRIKKVFIRGIKVFADGKILASPGFGQNIITG